MTCPVDITKMNVTEVSGVLREKLPTVKEETVSAFEREMIDSNALLELNTDDLKSLTGERKAIDKLLREYSTPTV